MNPEWIKAGKRGYRIHTVEQLEQLACSRRSVVGRFGWLHRPTPAAVILSMQARLVLRIIDAGLWLYQKKAKK